VTACSAIPFIGPDNLPAQKSPWAHRLLSFSGLHFHGLGYGKFPVSVWLGAQGTRMQFTSFLGRCTASRTRHGEYLFSGEFFGFHRDIPRYNATILQRERCSILLIFNTLAKAGLYSARQRFLSI
jgi:hypothetical protein